MTQQLALQFGKTISERFAQFHEQNPHVYTELESRALALYRAGRRHFGIALLWESMRYDWLVRTDSEPKLDNSLRALYARMLIDNHPQLANVIETRQRKAA